MRNINWQQYMRTFPSLSRVSLMYAKYFDYMSSTLKKYITTKPQCECTKILCEKIMNSLKMHISYFTIVIWRSHVFKCVCAVYLIDFAASRKGIFVTRNHGKMFFNMRRLLCCVERSRKNSRYKSYITFFNTFS